MDDKKSERKKEAKRKKIQRRISRFEEKYPEKYSEKFAYNRTRQQLSQQWVRMRNLNKTIVNLVSHNLIAIAKSWGVTAMRFEDLRFSRHAAKQKVGKFLARWQVMWFFRQVQAHVENRQSLEGYAFETVPAKNTSKRCSKCGRKGIRKGKDFKCHNHEHLYRLDADLNAARNIAQAQLRAAAT